MKKVLHLIWRIDGGGIESFCINLIHALKDKPISFDFVVCGKEYDSESVVQNMGCKIYHLPLIDGKEGKKNYLSALSVIIKENHYDIVHSHLAFMNISTLRLAKKLGVRIRISHTHVAGIGDKNSLKCLLKRYLMKKYATHCIACSKDTAEFYYGKVGEQVAVIYSGIDVERFKSEIVEKEEKSFIIVARICEEKNPYFIMDIIRNLIQLDPTYHFTWCGGGDMPTIMNDAKDIDRYIRFAGSVKNIENYLKPASYMLMPSLREGFGMAAVEAQIANVYVFASDCVPVDTNLGLIQYFPLSIDSSEWARRIDEFVKSNKKPSLSIDEKILEQYDMANIANLIGQKYYFCK